MRNSAASTSAPLSVSERLWLALALGVLTLPNAIYACTTGRATFWVGQLATSALLLLAPLLLGVRPAVVLRCLIPLALLTPVVAAYALATGYAPSLLALQVLREATREELSNYAAFIALAAGAAIALAVGFAWLARRLGPRRLAVPRGVRLAGLALLAAALAKDIVASGFAGGAPILLLRLEKMHPVAPLALAARVATLPRLVPDRSGVLAAHRAVHRAPAGPREICVLVIGESTRKRAFGLYNPALDTTPRLAARRDLIVFQQATACGTATIQSVPILLTGQFPDGGEILPFRHLSAVEAFRLAGFRTGWFSLQEADGEITSFITAFSSGAETRRFLNGRLERSRDRDPELKTDGALLPALASFLAAAPANAFVVLHTLGSHAPYTRRYPPEFERWPLDPAAKRALWRWAPPFDAFQREQLERAYLNSVAHTDWFLDQTIAALASLDAVTSLVFLGDHGENDAAAPAMPAGHAIEGDDIVNIPLLVWLSPQFRAARPALAEALAANARRPVSAQDIFSTLCALHGIDTSAADPTRNLAASAYVEHPRHILLLDGRVVTLPR